MMFENMKEAVAALSNAGVAPEGSRMENVIVRGFVKSQNRKHGYLGNFTIGDEQYFLIVAAPGHTKNTSVEQSSRSKFGTTDINLAQAALNMAVNEGLLDGSLMKLKTTRRVYEQYADTFGKATYINDVVLVNQPARVMLNEENVVLGAWPQEIDWGKGAPKSKNTDPSRPTPTVKR